MAEAQVQERQQSTALTPVLRVREELVPMQAQFGAVLPGHITAEKFTQVCITALENNPALVEADRQSFKVACLNAANDGLLPDKREGAFVIFNTQVDVKRPGSNATYKESRALVQWMPMITGVLKKAYQTGKIESISVELVHEHDLYRRAAGDNAAIVHEPLDFGDRGAVRGGYCIVRMRGGGEPYREVMSLQQIERVRNVSRTKDKGPWATFWEEMAKKTILRRTLKRVPLSAEVDQVLARDDVFYDLGAERRPMLEAPQRRAIPNDKLFSKAPLPAPEQDVIEGEVEEPTVGDAPEADASPPQEPGAEEPAEPADDDPLEWVVSARSYVERASTISDLKGLNDQWTDEGRWDALARASQSDHDDLLDRMGGRDSEIRAAEARKPKSGPAR